MVRPLMFHRVRGVEFFPASSPTNRGIVCSNTRQYPLKTQSHLRESAKATAPKQAIQASKSPRNSSFSAEEHAPSAERPSTNSQRTSSMPDEWPVAKTRAPSQVVEDGLTLSANGRKRTIMARYVFGNEDKPGERWKRRLLRSR